MRIVISEFISLDGVVQAPGGAEEDTEGGFKHGGWSMPFFDPDVMGAVVEGFAERNEVLLQGRRTYQVSAEAWPGRTGGFADWINAAQKYVVTDTLTDDDVSVWTPTTIIRVAYVAGFATPLPVDDEVFVADLGEMAVRYLLGAG